MNSLEPLLYSYTLINILIGIGFIFSVGSFKFVQKFRIPINSMYRLRISQVLLLGAILFGSLAPVFPRSLSLNFGQWISSQIKVAPLGLVGMDQDGDGFVQSKPAWHMQNSGPVEIVEEKSSVNEWDNKTIFSVVFLTGFVFVLGRSLFRIALLYRIIFRSTLLRRCQNVRILVSDQVSIPFSTRIFLKSDVVLPVNLLLSRKALKLAIQHEIQHHRSGDTLWIVFMEILSVFLFWNPFVYLWREQFNELQEFACDEALIIRGRVSRQDYGKCLIDFAESWMTSRQSLFGAAGMASAFRDPNLTQSLLKRRIEMLFAYQKSQSGVTKALLLGGTSITGLLMIAAIAGGRTEAGINATLVEVEPSIQKIANQALAEGVKKSKAEDGFAVVSDPMTGSILALAYYDGIAHQAMDVKRAADLILSKVHAPQSLIKPIIIAAALGRKKINLTEKINCEKGTYIVNGTKFHDHSDFGDLSVAEIVAQSSDIGTIKIAERLGKEGLLNAASDFGLGTHGTASYLPGAAQGHIPPVINQHSVAQILTDFYIGKNTYSSPIELVQAYGAIVNGGKLLKPTLFQNAGSNPSVIRQVISPETSEEMKKMLTEVVTKGTAKKAMSSLYVTAGKTGTASAYIQTPQGSVYDKNHAAAYFIGTAPAQPKVVVYVVIEKPEASGHGGTHAAPVFSQIAEKTLQYLNVKPDRI